MGRANTPQLPVLQRMLREIGKNIRLARLRRKYSSAIVSERAGITRPTLCAVERGDPGVSLGTYANVLFCLGLHRDLEKIAHNDPLGRKLQDAEVTLRQRAPRRSRQKGET